MAAAQSLILSDGGLGSLIACTVARESSPRRSALVLPILWEPGDHSPRIAAAARQAERSGLGVLPSEPQLPQAPTPVLVHAALAAAGAGIPSVIWPVHAGPGPEPDLDRLAQAVDRALLVSRLVAIDSPEHGCPNIRVEAPYADMADRQLVDLALDLDAPVETCWWWNGQGGSAAAERQRWLTLLESRGWSPV